MTVTASQVAYKAAEIMSELGHCKGVTQDEDGRVCYEGALIQAIRALGQAASPYEACQTWLYDHIDRCAALLVQERAGVSLPFGPVTYNDLPYTTGEDVISLLKETGARLEEAS